MAVNAIHDYNIAFDENIITDITDSTVNPEISEKNLNNTAFSDVILVSGVDGAR